MPRTHVRGGRPLYARNFTCIASGGFGDSQNNRAHAMVWFQGKLYVGITRHRELGGDGRANFEDIQRRPPPQPGVGQRSHYLDQPAQIWRYDPKNNQWQKVFVPPMVNSPDGDEIPRDVGYRKMVVFQRPHDPAPALYVSTVSIIGSLILRSEDGERFVPVSTSGLSGLKAWSYRTLLPFNGRLYTSPVGRMSGELIERNTTESPMVFENVDPVVAPWHPVSEAGFGDPTNSCIYEMVSFNGFLYGGTFNPYRGFQIWKMRAQGSPPYQWKQVITDGAFRGNANEAAASMCVFSNALYVGTGIQGLGYDKEYNAGPAEAELIRIYPDDSWDLIVGESRHTFDGVKIPLSGLGPGFNNRYNSVIWQMAEHDGWLYAGTHNWCSYLAFFKPSFSIGKARHWGRAIDGLLEKEGGFDLWRSRTGINWEPVTRVGFGNPNNYGLRTMVSAPVGLFIGTASVPHTIAGGRGGCEICLGR